MLQKTKGIVLRSIKYGDSSLVTTIFTEVYGVQTYMVQGVRSSSASRNRAGSFQPGTLLDMIVYQQPQKNMQRIKEFHAAYLYTTLQEDVTRNSILLFSAEIMLRLLPEHAPLETLFSFAFQYFVSLDQMPLKRVANFPLYFIINASRIMGYELKGEQTETTPHLDLQEGGFTANTPRMTPFVSDDDARMLSKLLKAPDADALGSIEMNAEMRMRLIDWYIAFLQMHTQHMGNVKSLSVLRTILH